MGKKQFYPEEVKQEVIQLKLSGEWTNQQIMEKFGIKSKSQIKTWMKWYREGEHHRLAQPIGKQYTYGKGPEDDSELSQLRRKVTYYEMRDELEGKYREIERRWKQTSL
ncbi:transposase-like protein [Alkalibacillus salilacus]|uniref:Transposase-like protein n=1 Tax=Alkalibacillus salilacus TaxID=284582 RepID=A0ABT9VIY5_9BACI|nr:transposase-like protein [Alkalibacillus salilacus]